MEWYAWSEPTPRGGGIGGGVGSDRGRQAPGKPGPIDNMRLFKNQQPPGCKQELRSKFEPVQEKKKKQKQKEKNEKQQQRRRKRKQTRRKLSSGSDSSSSEIVVTKPLLLAVDYRVVSSKVWRTLHDLYGGGPIIRTCDPNDPSAFANGFDAENDVEPEVPTYDGPEFECKITQRCVNIHFNVRCEEKKAKGCLATCSMRHDKVISKLTRGRFGEGKHRRALAEQFGAERAQQIQAAEFDGPVIITVIALASSGTGTATEAQLAKIKVGMRLKKVSFIIFHLYHMTEYFGKFNHIIIIIILHSTSSSKIGSIDATQLNSREEADQDRASPDLAHRLHQLFVDEPRPMTLKFQSPARERDNAVRAVKKGKGCTIA